ncbi:MAG: hypothetical protein CMJ18_20110 [Phycisphaeraceae bacterium]|nr:hypothetical protein [Phycisphaeraceae bacterium]
MTRFMMPTGKLMVMVAAIGLAACDQPGEPAGGEDTAAPRAHTHEKPGETCYICDERLRDPGRLWCNGHGRYEDRCWLCQPQLEDKNRAYCTAHFLYEDECHLCHPELQAKKPQEQATASGDPASLAAPETAEAPRTPRELITARPAPAPTQKLFCREHGVWEHECGICQPQMASRLKPGESMKVRFASKTSTLKAGIRTAPPRQSESAPTVKAFCQVRYNENELAHITPRAPGIVARVAVDVGASVKRGDVLAVLESPVLAEAKSDHLAKLQTIELARIDLDRSRLIHENAKKALALLESTPALDELARLSDLELGLHRKALLGAHAAFISARAAYQREKQLLADDISSKADYQAAEAAYQTAWADHLATRDDIAFSTRRDVESRSRTVRTATFALESARRRLATLGLTGAGIDAISTETSGNLSRYELRAPFAGTVVERKAVAGESVETGHMLFTLADLSKMWLSLSIPADRVAQISTDSRVEAVIPNLPGVVVSGKLTWVDTSIDERTRMVRARAIVPNAHGQLKSGMFGEVNIAVGTASRALRVPRSAVQRLERQPYIFVKLDDDLYALRRVALGNESDTAVDIVAGIRREDQVVVAGTFTVMSEYLKSRLGAGCVDH